MTDNDRHRLCIAARAPGLTAAQLVALASADTGLEFLERATQNSLAPFAMPDAARAWLAKWDAARIAADERWLDSAGVTLLAATSPLYPPLLAQLPDAPA